MSASAVFTERFRICLSKPAPPPTWTKALWHDPNLKIWFTAAERRRCAKALVAGLLLLLAGCAAVDGGTNSDTNSDKEKSGGFYGGVTSGGSLP
jgi:hypothetical protein